MTCLNEQSSEEYMFMHKKSFEHFLETFFGATSYKGNLSFIKFHFLKFFHIILLRFLPPHFHHSSISSHFRSYHVILLFTWLRVNISGKEILLRRMCRMRWDNSKPRLRYFSFLTLVFLRDCKRNFILNFSFFKGL